MKLFYNYLNTGIQVTDTRLQKKGKQIYNFDIICGILLPVFSEIILQINGFCTAQLSFINLIFSLSFLTHLFLIYFNRYQLSVILFQLNSYVIIVIAIIFSANIMISLFLIILALNMFIYFPDNKKLATRFFVFLGLSTVFFFTLELSRLNMEIIDVEFLTKLKSLFLIFAFLISFKVFSLVILYGIAILDKEESEKELIKSEDRHRSLFENAQDGIVIFDLEQRKIINCNQKMSEIFTMDTLELMENFPFSNLAEHLDYDKPGANFMDQQTRRVLKLGKSKFTIETQKANGDELIAEVNTFKLPSPNQHLVVSTFRDITDKKRQEALIKQNIITLNQKNIDLEKYIESNIQLENFAHIASHDLKAPI